MPSALASLPGSFKSETPCFIPSATPSWWMD